MIDVKASVQLLAKSQHGEKSADSHSSGDKRRAVGNGYQSSNRSESTRTLGNRYLGRNRVFTAIHAGGSPAGT
jgi:hypothetical protein